MNLKRRAEREGVSCATARRWFESDELPAPARRAGRMILADEPRRANREGITAVYARVSSAGQEADLDRQVARVTAWAAGEGLAVGRMVTGAGSALDGRRRKSPVLLRDESVTVIAAERRGRFARFGAGYAEAALHAQDRRLPGADPAGTGGDLTGHVTEILTSLCASRYGRQAAADCAARAVAALEQDPS